MICVHLCAVFALGLNAQMESVYLYQNEAPQSGRGQTRADEFAQ